MVLVNEPNSAMDEMESEDSVQLSNRLKRIGSLRKQVHFESESFISYVNH